MAAVQDSSSSQQQPHESSRPTPPPDNSQKIPLYKIPDPIPEHPEGDAIRRQVEYYFSGQNLPNDVHLFELCGGTQNLPVSINEILGWHKMRRYKPKSQVIVALKKSAFLEVVDNKRIRRRVPLVLDDEPNDEELATDFVTKEKANEQQPLVAPTPRRLPDPSKPWITKGFLKPTGFEEGWADPATPAEADEEKELYSPEESFADRIEMAIERFRQRRKFHQAYASHFTAWLRYGGFETGPRQFTGNIDQSVLEGRSAAEKARILAIYFAGDDKEDEEQWAVDFEGVAKGYLSQLFEPDEKETDLVTRIMMNFYNYLLHHNVCPEYNDQIEAARQVCLLAIKELRTVYDLVKKMPGAFNNACSLIFGGNYAQMHPADMTWSSIPQDPGMKMEEARIIFTTATAALGSDAMFSTFTPERLASVTNQEAVKYPDTKKSTPIWCSAEVTTHLEVIGIDRASDEIRDDYADYQRNLVGSKVKLEPLGKLICKPWTHPNFQGFDLPEGVAFDEQVYDDTYEFWLEDNLVALWCEGMKLNCTLRRLEWIDNGKRDGLWYIDSFGNAYPSFYECLLNEIMEKPWKPVVYSKDKEAAAAAAQVSSDKADIEEVDDDPENRITAFV